MPVSRNRKRTVKVVIDQNSEAFVPDRKLVNRLEWWARLTQPVPLVMELLRFTIFTRKQSLGLDIVFWGGISFMLFSQMRIMLTTRFTNKRRLFTGDVFKYTRHPMYTGLVIADLSLWPGNWYRLFFPETVMIFYTTLIFVGYLHEQEILAKFGPAAEKYYARTPRLFFLYPFLKKE